MILGVIPRSNQEPLKRGLIFEAYDGIVLYKLPFPVSFIWHMWGYYMNAASEANVTPCQRKTNLIWSTSVLGIVFKLSICHIPTCENEQFG